MTRPRLLISRILCFENLVCLLVILFCSLILYVFSFVLFKSVFVREIGGASIFTFSKFLIICTDAGISRAFLNTIVSGLGSALIATAVGVTLAWLVGRTDMPGRNIFRALNIIPFFMSTLQGAIAWKILAVPNAGLLNGIFHELLGVEPFNIYGLLGLICVMGLFSAPVVYIFVLSTLESMDPSLEESSRIAGRGVIGTAVKVTLPMAWPSITAGFLLVWISCAGKIGPVVILSSPYGVDTLATEISAYTNEWPADFSFAASISLILVGITVLSGFIQRKLALRRDYTLITGKGYIPRLFRLRKWKPVAAIFNLAFVMGTLLLPLTALTLVSTQRAWTGTFRMDMLTVDNFAYLLNRFDMTQRAISNSILLSALGASFCIVISFFASYWLYRVEPRSRGLLETIIMAPMGIAGVVIGLGVFLGFISTPLYQTLGLLFIGYVILFTPWALKPISSALLCIDKELEQSARTCGSAPATVLAKITFPLLRPAIFGSWLLVFVMIMRETELSVMLSAPGTEVFSTALLSVNQTRGLPTLAALTLIQIAIVLLVFLVYRKTVGTKRLSI